MTCSQHNQVMHCSVFSTARVSLESGDVLVVSWLEPHLSQVCFEVACYCGAVIVPTVQRVHCYAACEHETIATP